MTQPVLSKAPAFGATKAPKCDLKNHGLETKQRKWSRSVEKNSSQHPNTVTTYKPAK